LPFKIVKDSIYLVTKGQIKLHFVYADGKKEFIKAIEAGEVWFGGETDIKHVKGIEYVYVECPTNTQVILLRISDLYYQISYQNIYKKIIKMISLEDHASKSHNEKHMISMQLLNEKELQYRVVGTQYFVVAVLLAMCSYVFIFTSAEQIIHFFKSSTPATLFITIGGVFLFNWGLKRGHIPLTAIGITLANTKAAVRDALISVVIFLFLAVIFKYVLIQLVPAFHDLYLFNLAHTIQRLGGLNKFITLVLIYIFVVATLQEFICRGIIQGSLQQIFWSERSPWKPIFISNLFFSVMHLMISPMTAIVVFFPGLCWGWLFARHNNLIGVIVAHGLLGGIAFFILGYAELLS
jgi:membrane protease YdiL (CAAX protease family)